MASNAYGLDVSYFKKKLEILLRDIDNYTPDEFARECARMSKTADESVMSEPEFASNVVIEKVNGSITINMS